MNDRIQIKDLDDGVVSNDDFVIFQLAVAPYTVYKTTKLALKGDKGDTGDPATATVGTTSTLAPGSAATVVNSGTIYNAIFDFGIPQGLKGDTGEIGMDWQGAYNALTAYHINDGVYYLGSSYICIQAATGEAPDVPGSLYWNLIAAKGADGTGSGDVNGPASAVDGNIALFDTNSGKLIKDSGYDITDFAPALTSDENYVSDAEKIKLSNLSGVNTGDQTLPTRNSLGLDTDDDVTFNSIKLTDGAGLGKVLTSDADGNATWERSVGNLGWTEITTNTTAEEDKGYVVNSSNLIYITLPTTAAFGTVLGIQSKGSGGWALLQNANQKIHKQEFESTTGEAGGLLFDLVNDAVVLVCVVANLEWNVVSSEGNILVI